MLKYRFNLFWSAEDEEYVVTCPDFPGVSALGETPEEALAEVQIALQLSIETYEAHGWELPKTPVVPRHSGKFPVRTTKSLHEKLARQADVEGVSLNQLVVSYLAEQSTLHDVRVEMRGISEQIARMRRELQQQLWQWASAERVTTSKVTVPGHTVYNTVTKVGVGPYPQPSE